VSGDTSCADHIIAWKVRHRLNLDNVPAGISATGDDNIIFAPSSGLQAAFAHPNCAPVGDPKAIAEALPKTHPIGPNPYTTVPDDCVRRSHPAQDLVSSFRPRLINELPAATAGISDHSDDIYPNGVTPDVLMGGQVRSRLDSR
jgi:hypothetical protein